jgi:peptide/nickel transport system permease protein
MLILWSDLVLWLLVAFLVIFVWRLRHDHQATARWISVLQSHTALASLVILLTFISIALIDSIHWRTDDPYRPVVSLLDMSLGKIATVQEKSYSAPFASHGLWQETQQLADGSIQRTAIPLKQGQDHTSIWLASLAWFLLGAGLARLVLLQTAKSVMVQTTRIPWRTAGITIIVIAGFIAWLWGMGQSYHLLGTGKVGQDVLYETLKGIRTGILIGSLTTLLTLPFAIALGIAAGYFRGWVDDAVQYTYTTLNAVPGVLLIASAMLLAQMYLAQHAEIFASEQERADVRLLLVCLVLGLTGWTGLARILRAEALKLREMEFVKSARAFGVSNARILSRHLLPNVGHLILIAIVLDFSGLVLAEAVLSYIGIGVDPTMPSWGNMINLARQELNREPVVWWNLLGAFTGMFILVLSANLLADRIQQVFNPRTG